VDLSKLSPSQQITVGAAGAMVIVSFLPWFGNQFINVNAWSSGFTALAGTLLVIAAGVILVMESSDMPTVDSPAEIVFYLSAAGLAFVAIRLLFTWGAPRKFGIFLALIAAGVATWGAFQNRADNS